MANTSGSGLQSRISTEESARASADSALATRATTLEAQMANTSGSGLQSRISTEETTRASADSTLASRSTVLESIAASGSPGANLVFNSALTSLDGYEVTSSGTGPFLRGLNLSNPTWGNSTNPTGYLNVNRTGVGSETVMDERSPRFRLRPNQRYGFAARLAPHRATASVRLEFLDTSGAFLSNTSLITGGTEGGAGSGNPANFTTLGAFAIAPANTAFGRVVVRLAGNGQDDPYVFWQAMDCFQASEGQTALRPHQDGPPLDRTADLLTATARIATEETTRASADSALAGRATTLEAQMANTAGSGLQSRISTEESVRASADSTLAFRSTTLESSFRFPVPEALNKNPTFATWSGTSGTLPEDWLSWVNGEINTKATGDLSPNAYRQSNPAGAVNYGIYHLLNGRMTQGNYVLEADVTLNSGVFNGAALYCQWGVSSITVDERIEFTTALDVSGSAPGAGVVGRRYRFSKMIYVSNTAELFGLYIMTNGAGFATSGNAKDLTWHKALVRPATQGEIDAKVAKDTTIPTTIARIATEETTRASADSALASRATTLESQIANTAASGLQSRIATEESTRASADSTQASQITTLTAQANGNPNLFPYPTPITNRTPTQLGWTGTPISTIFAAFVGGLVYYKARGSGGSAVNEAYIYNLPEEFYFQTGSSYTFSCYGYGGSGAVGDRVYAYLEFRSADNLTTLHTSAGVTLNSISTRQSVTGTFPGAGTAGRLRVVFLREWPASGAYQDVVFNMIKVEAGTVATVFTNSAQVQTFASTSIDAYGRAYAISGTQTEVNGRKGGFVMDNNGAVTNFQITADDFRIYQSVGGPNIVPFRVVGGQTQIDDALIRNLNVIPDGGGPSHRVQLRPNSVSGADGASFTFSTTYGGIPLVRSVITSPPALAAGETYEVVPVSLSASGFTIRAKKFTPGTPTAQSSGAGSNVGGTPAWQVHKPTSADADGGLYTFTYTARLTRVSNEFTGSNWYAEFEGYYDVYYNAGSGWVFAYTDTYYFAGFYSSSPSTVDVSASTTASLPAIGQHGGTEFGLHPTLGSITAFAGVSYTTTSQSSVVALPGNFTFDIYPPT